MCSILLITILAHLTVITFGISSPFDIDEGSELELPKWNISNDELWFNVHNFMQQNVKSGSCYGWCLIDQEKNVTLLCQLMDKDNSPLYLDVTVKNIKRDYSGTWACDFYVSKLPHFKSVPSSEETTKLRCDFELYVQYADSDMLTLYIGLGVLVIVIVLLLIGGQTACIIHYKSKARAVSRTAHIDQLSTRRDETNENTARYSRMPVLRKTSIAQETRESEIYEDPEKLLASPSVKPEPPPLSRLPRTPKPPHMSVPHPGTPKPTAKLRSATNGVPMVPVSVHRTKQKFPTSADTVRQGKSPSPTAERNKSRPPEPLPQSDVEYEVMNTPPWTPASEAKFSKPPRPTPPPKKKPRDFQTLQLPPRNTSPIPGVSQTLKPSMISAQQMKILASQIREAKELQKSVPSLLAPSPLSPKSPRFATPKPAPPVKRQPPPVLPKHPQPESIPATTADMNKLSDDEDEWTYEPLGQYNIYNI